MASNLRIIADNWSDLAALSASPALALPASNLQTQSRGEIMRTTGVATQQILGDFDQARICSACALVRHNLTSAATWRLELFSGAGQSGTTVYDSGSVTALPGYGWGEFRWGVDAWGGSIFLGWGQAFSNLWFAATPALSFRLTISDPGNPVGYLQASRLVIGAYFEPLRNMSSGVDVSWAENSAQRRTDGGSLRTDGRVAYRRWQFSLDFLNAAERGVVLDVFRRAGLRGDLFISCYPGLGGAQERDHAGLVKLVRMPGMRRTSPELYASELLFEES